HYIIDELFAQGFRKHCTSLLLGMSSLEAYVNSISEELCSNFNLEIYEKAMLSEREIKVDKGKVVIGNKLKITRLIDRIELIYCKYSRKDITESDIWDADIKQTIDIRNKLVHPKEMMKLTYVQTEKALENILNTVNVLFRTVYGKMFQYLIMGCKLF
ncbi:MAG: hypothetical protein LIO76_06435, partial [Clostridiales bacterium]|nr:hypothetical protein [Clostridiales bacterium]